MAEERTQSPPNPLAPRQCTPAGFVRHVYERERELPVAREHVWGWLNTPETFTRQVWPFWVEFVEGSGVRGGGGFEVGTLNVHHGPLLHCPGVITAVDEGEDGRGRMRELLYCYGAYIIGMKTIRPVELTFWVGDAGEGSCVLRLRVSCDIRPWIGGFWTWASGVFWGSFFRQAAAGGRRHAKRAGV